MLETDIVVIGSGIAGASVAAHLAETRRVVLVEQETRPGYHSTGRSAALFSEIYGNSVIRALTRGSREFFERPPQSLAAGPLIKPRGCLYIATASQLDAVERFIALEDVEPATRRLDAAAALELCPVLRENHVAAAVYEPDSFDIDVHALHDGYLRLFRRREGRALYDAPVQEIKYDGQRWHVRAGAENLAAPRVVNAAGAWADAVASLAGVQPLELGARRRTALLIEGPAGIDVSGWPMVLDIDEQFYFKPDAGLLLLSPADETPTAAGDAQPEEWDVAVAVDRMEAATTLAVRSIRRRWAGLRTFAPDRTPVVGYSRSTPGFFWLAGQGGYGIQTAPALSRLAAALVLGEPLPTDLQQLGICADDLSPARLEIDRVAL
jgi:D-arginine dehydrogenase